jgi:hypothetical protein
MSREKETNDKSEEFGHAPNEPHDSRGRPVGKYSNYPNVGLWDCTFYLLDDDGNELMDDEGKVIIFTAPHVDYAGVFDYITVHDLEEMSDMSETNELL